VTPWLRRLRRLRRRARVARGLLACGLAGALACGELVTSPALVGTIRVEALSRQGAPLPGIKAILYNGDRHLGYALTDAAGRATFSRVTMGTYGVFMALPSEYAGLDEISTAPRNDFAAPLNVRAGSDTTLAFTFLRRGYGSLVAEVEDSTGAPIAGITVHLYNAAAILASLPTDVAGRVTFEPLLFGNYGVFVAPPDSLGVTGSPPIYRDGLFVDRDYVATASFVLARCQGTVQVLVEDDLNAPVVGHPVELYSYDGVRGSATTGLDGRATLANVACGEYGVRARPRDGYTIVDAAGEGYVDGLVLGNGALVNATVRVVRIP
jgi:hypothetical protein